jgi:hypothetical protein
MSLWSRKSLKDLKFAVVTGGFLGKLIFFATKMAIQGDKNWLFC